MSIPKRLSAAILNSLSAGVVPRLGLEYIAVGRRREIETLLRDMENLGQGAASFRFISGRYGSGKTFFLQAIRNYAMENGFLVADADLSPEKRFTGSRRAGLETYRELISRLSTKLRPGGGALESLLQQWINSVKMDLIAKGAPPEDETLLPLLETGIFQTIAQMEDYAHGFDFAAAIAAYYRGFVAGNDEKKHAALKWLRGEFAARTEAKALLPVGEIINDENWYEYLKVFSAFGARIGYRGLLIFFDECATLYKITNRQSRDFLLRAFYKRNVVNSHKVKNFKTLRITLFHTRKPPGSKLRYNAIVIFKMSGDNANDNLRRCKQMMNNRIMIVRFTSNVRMDNNPFFLNIRHGKAQTFQNFFSFHRTLL